MPEFTRKINIEMDWLDPGQFEIRGSLDDNVHSLAARLVVSFPGFVIQNAIAEITRMPYPGYCTGATGAIQRLVGERIGRGFKRKVGEALGGAESCNHLHTLVNDLASCAFQMNYVAAKTREASKEELRRVLDDHSRRRELVLKWMPQLRNSCFVFSERNDPLFQIEPSAGDSTDPGASTD
ncbi:MAG TPA: DUF2889 domain-containing protein [Blastocatellia bacterium]|nr:DUF2889 domain-containing protein [Blastocatellia bacterium]